MTDPQKPGLENIPERKSTAAMGGSEAEAVEPARLAAYLNGGLGEDEMEEMRRIFAASPAAMADLMSAIDLLESTENSSLRAPESVRQRSRAIFAEGVKKSPVIAQEPTRSWFAMPWFRVFAGFAAVAIVAVIIFRSQLPIPGQAPSTSSLASSQSDSGSRSAMLPGQTGGPTSISPPVGAGSWGALAVSRTTKAYGSARGAGSREEAEKSALADCAARQGTNCVVAEAGRGECFAIAREIDGPPVTAAAANIATVSKRALEACTIARKEIFPCAVQSAFCAEK